MKANKILLNIVSVFCFLFGVLYIFSLIFIPIGIYCLSAGKKFNYKADHLLDNYAVDKRTMKIYSILVSVFCFPFGLLVIIPYVRLYGNNVKVDGFEYTKITEVEKSDDLVNNQDEVVENIEENQEQINETEDEKFEKLEKLKNFRDKNIISEEEFEMAKEQMFGKDKK